MESTKQQPNRKVIITLIVVILAVVGVALAVVLSRNSETEITDSETPKIGYAIEGVTAVDEDSLQKAVDEMNKKAAEGNIALEYKNDAFSDDGKNISCYIANSLSNEYDMYIQIFSDDAMKDQLFLSGLLRPGTAFETIALEKELARGDHMVYVAFTQVEEDLETIHGQVIVTMNFHVTK